MSQHQTSGSSRKIAAQARFEKLLVQQSSTDRLVPIDYRALGDARLQVMEASSCHSDRAPTNDRARRAKRKEQEVQRAAKTAFYRIAPALLEVKQLLLKNGVDNLYWLGTKPNGDGVFFVFIFPPGVSDALVEQLSGPVRHLIQRQSPIDDATSLGWDSMSIEDQFLYSMEAIPVFKRDHLMAYID